MPMVVRRCETCYMHVFNDEEHTCNATKVASLRTFVYATAPLPLLDIESSGTLFQIYSSTRKFQLAIDGQKMLIPSTDGMVTIKKNDFGIVATYSAASFKRVGIIIAEHSGAFGILSLLFRIEITAHHGLKFQKLDFSQRLRSNRFTLPEIYNMNTAFILAVQPKSMMKFRLYANQSGVIDNANFNGICVSGSVGSHAQIEEHKVIQF